MANNNEIYYTLLFPPIFRKIHLFYITRKKILILNIFIYILNYYIE